jgi:hypothetical protein
MKNRVLLTDVSDVSPSSEFTSLLASSIFFFKYFSVYFFIVVQNVVNVSLILITLEQILFKAC